MGLRDWFNGDTAQENTIKQLKEEKAKLQDDLAFENEYSSALEKEHNQLILRYRYSGEAKLQDELRKSKQEVEKLKKEIENKESDITHLSNALSHSTEAKKSWYQSI
jgi:predicted RNase H-like nuclease (RuvC/YqgF family)